MFLTLLQRRNPALLAAAAALHQAGDLPANTYVLDLATIEQNAAALAAESERLGLTPFAMTKQIGRNPDASRAVRAGGLTHAVGVDVECAVAAAHGGLAVGHIGHLVQVPRAQAATAARLAPSYWTVFSEHKAAEAAAAAHELGRTQDLLVRVSAPGDRFYTGHEGGVDASDIVAVADRIDAMPGARFAGVTTFPATLFDAATGRATSTPNLRTLTRAAEALRAAGRDRVELNAPGTTSVSVLATLAEAGATQVEPGHGLTGTTPLHAVEDLVEAPAVAYVSEVSHVWNDTAYVFGGGLYVDPVLGGTRTEALVVRRGAGLSEAQRLVVDMPAPEAIDYYARIPLGSGTVEPGDTVLFGFRPQVFVTRGLTAGLRDLDSTPRVVGTWSANGAEPLVAPDLTSARSNA